MTTNAVYKSYLKLNMMIFDDDKCGLIYLIEQLKGDIENVHNKWNVEDEIKQIDEETMV